MPNFTHAIVRTPCRAVVEGITSNPQLGRPDYARALAQHAGYIDALKSCGLDVTVLPADDAFPDSCFVEDPAIVTENCAVLTYPGAQSRAGEAKSIAPAIEKFYPPSRIHRIEAPGTLEGGDVMRVENRFYAGLSARTNAEGIRQLRTILAPYGYAVEEVPLAEVLHLKTGVNYLDHNHLLVSGEFITKPAFAGYDKTLIPDDEAYAANSLWINGKVLVPAGFPKVEAIIRGLGYPVVSVDTSEFRKIDGGLSCLSLRFKPPVG